MGTEFTIQSDLSALAPLKDMVQEALQEFAYTDREICLVQVALEESFVNAVKHGNQLDPNKRVRIAYTVTPERFDISITDEGDGFDPEPPPDPTAGTGDLVSCGRGLLLMRGLMTEVRFNDLGNSVQMTKVREAST